MAGKRYHHVSTSPDHPRGGRSEMDGTWEAGKGGVWHGQLANSSLPYCWYAGIVLLEEKIVPNILIDWQDMYVKAFIHIALACK